MKRLPKTLSINFLLINGGLKNQGELPGRSHHLNRSPAKAGAPQKSRKNDLPFVGAASCRDENLWGVARTGKNIRVGQDPKEPLRVGTLLTFEH